MLLLFSGFISRILVSDFLLNRVIENTRQSLDIIIQSIDSVLNDVETGALRVASDPVVQGILIKEPEKELTEGLDQYFLVKSILDKILYIRNYIDSISVYRLDGSPVGSGYINYGKASEKKRLSAVFVRMDRPRITQVYPGTTGGFRTRDVPNSKTGKSWSGNWNCRSEYES